VGQQNEAEDRHGKAGGQPGLSVADAAAVLAYWWRNRGRHWSGWHKALDRLKSLGIPVSPASLPRKLTEKQARVVWRAATEAAMQLGRLAPLHGRLTPSFGQQAYNDSARMVVRWYRGDLKSKIDAPPKKKRKTRPSDMIPRKPPKAPVKDEDIEKLLPPSPRRGARKVTRAATMVVLAAVLIALLED